MTVESRVAQGASWLDIQQPDWYTHTDPDGLHAVTNCVLDVLYQTGAQSDGFLKVFHYLATPQPATGWRARIRAYRAGREQATKFCVEHGFISTRWATWKRCWKNEIMERRYAKPATVVLTLVRTSRAA